MLIRLKGNLSLRSSNRRLVNSSGSGNVVFLSGNHLPRPTPSYPPLQPTPSNPPIPSNPPTRYHFLHTSLPNNLSTSSKGVVLSECEAPNQCICIAMISLLAKQLFFWSRPDLFVFAKYFLTISYDQMEITGAGPTDTSVWTTGITSSVSSANSEATVS